MNQLDTRLEQEVEIYQALSSTQMNTHQLSGTPFIHHLAFH